MFTKNKTFAEVVDFKCKYGRYKYYDGSICEKLGEGRSKDSCNDVIVFVDSDKSLRIVPREFFEGKILLLSKGFVPRFVPTN